VASERVTGPVVDVTDAADGAIIAVDRSVVGTTDQIQTVELL
jgi:hypothetical protein